MKFIKKAKKGFTLVELVVVIAIIAILSGVSVAIYSGVTNKAKQSADSQVVSQLNLQLKAQSVYGKNINAYEAYEDAMEIGFDLAKMTPQYGDCYVWDQEHDLFAVMKGDDEIVVQDSEVTLTEKNVQRWIFTDTISATEKRSQFFTDTEYDGEVDVISGFDAGLNNNDLVVNYSSAVAQDAIIRTNGGKLTVNDANESNQGSVTHYGTLSSASVSTNDNCFHTHGTIDYLSLTDGKIIAEENGLVYLFEAESDTAAYEENGGVIVIPSGVTTEDIKATEGSTLKASLEETGYTFQDDKINQPADIGGKVAELSGVLGSGTEIDPYILYDAETMHAISNLYTTNFAYYKVCIEKTENGVIDCQNWIPVYLNGSFDGCGVKFVNVDSCLFQNVGYQNNNNAITLENFTATMNVSANQGYGAAALIKNVFNSGTTTFDSVNIHGKIEGYWNLGSYYNYGPANYDDVGCDYTVNFINCKSDATLICTSGNTCGGFLGHGYEGEGHTQTLNIDGDSDYTGVIYTTGGNGGHYIAMNSTGRLVFNGVETSRYDSAFTAYSNNKKITLVAPTLGDSGYSVEVGEGTSKILVSVTAQLTAYDDNDEKIQNLSGITMTLDSSVLTGVTSSDILLDKVTSATIDNAAEEYGYVINDGVMTVKVPGNQNYREGTVRISISQYDSNGTLLCCGTSNVYTIKK